MIARMNGGELVLPTVERVRHASSRFDRENEIVEQALRELFDQFPSNANQAHVLLKVVALNRLYSTGILAVHDVARHIHQHALEIDSALVGENCRSEIVDRIAKVTVASSGKQLTFYSFASKYCNWHKPDQYPIWDSRVSRYLRCLRRSSFGLHLTKHGELWNVYQEFLDIMIAFQKHFGLDSLGFKAIDKFLWTYGGEDQILAVGASTD